MDMVSHLVPESDLSRVPARNSCGEQTLRISQEHHSVHTVVLTTGLLVDQIANVTIQRLCPKTTT